MDTLLAPTPAVSVVIPCYRQAHVLPEAVLSVLNQTFSDWECIIVDDGCPDDAGMLADAIARKHPGRVRVVHQSNRGVSEARNAGIRAARGRYILPLDADDRIAPEMLAKTVAALEAHPSAAIAHTHVQHFGNRNDVSSAGPLTLANAMTANLIPACSLYRRAVWDAVGGYSPSLACFEDWDFWLGALERGFEAVIVPEPLFCRRIVSAGPMTAVHERAFARIVLNHRSLYAPAMVDTARRKLFGTPTVSVIVTTTGQERGTKRALRSLLAQTLPGFDIIVVNDGSTAAVEELVRSLDGAGKATVVGTGQVRGRAAARNLGLRAARGRYIAYLDENSLYHTNHLATLAHALETTDARIAYGGAVLLKASEGNDETPAEPTGAILAIDYTREALLAAHIAPAVALMHERTLVDEVGWFDETLGAFEDWDFVLRVAAITPPHLVRNTTCALPESEVESTAQAEFHSIVRARISDRYGAKIAKAMSMTKEAGSAPVFTPPSELALQFLESTANTVLVQAGGEAKAAEIAAKLEEQTKGGDSNPDAFHDLALVYLALGRPGDAEQTLRTASVIASFNVDIRLALTHFCLAAGRIDEAVKHLESILAVAPSEAKALVLAGDASLTLGRADEAADFYRAARTQPALQSVADARLVNLGTRPQEATVAANP